MGYNTLPAPSLPSEAQDPFPSEGPAPASQLGVQELDRWDLEAGLGLVGQPRSFGGGRTMGPPAPPPLRGVEQQPRLIQRMESGYESSERNSSSPDRWGGIFCLQCFTRVGCSWNQRTLFVPACCLFIGRWGNRNGC